MAADTSDPRDIETGLLNVHVELGRFGIVVDISAPGTYNPDQLDDMTTRAQRTLRTAANRYVAIVSDLSDEPLDDDWEHDGKPPVGDLVTEAPNPT